MASAAKHGRNEPEPQPVIIVKKIVEEHLGEIAFLDRKGGGTHVRIAFDAERLAALEVTDSGDGSGDRPDGNEPPAGQINDVEPT